MVSEMKTKTKRKRHRNSIASYDGDRFITLKPKHVEIHFRNMGRAGAIKYGRDGKYNNPSVYSNLYIFTYAVAIGYDDLSWWHKLSDVNATYRTEARRHRMSIILRKLLPKFEFREKISTNKY